MTIEFRALPGIGVGTIAASGKVLQEIPTPTTALAISDSAQQSRLLSDAINTVAARLAQKASEQQGEAREILEALELILRDRDLAASANAAISQGRDAASSFEAAISNAILQLGEQTELATDIRGLGKQVLIELAGEAKAGESGSKDPVVRVCENISTVEVMMPSEHLVAVITRAGSPTSHAAIVARAIGLPLVVGCAEAESLVPGEKVLVDPAGDRVVVGVGLEHATKPKSFTPVYATPCARVQTNIGTFEDLNQPDIDSADGVGLIRTELLFLDATTPPTLSEQRDVYARLFRASPPGPVIARSWDLSLDKELRFARGHSLDELLATQLEALEAARKDTGRKLWVMAPMIESRAQALRFSELARAVGDFKIGIMVERKAIISELGELGDALEFVSVGTNDLLQDLLGLDRISPKDASKLTHWNPILIAALAEIAQATRANGLHSGVCGESASDPVFAIVLAGLGFDSVSVSPTELSAVREALRSVNSVQAQQVALAVASEESLERCKSRALSKLSEFEG